MAYSFTEKKRIRKDFGFRAAELGATRRQVEPSLVGSPPPSTRFPRLRTTRRRDGSVTDK